MDALNTSVLTNVDDTHSRSMPGIHDRSKTIKKYDHERKFNSQETQHFIVSYVRNNVTNRMNKVWTCKAHGCGKLFTKVCSLKDHLRLHLNERPYPRAYCGRGWSQAGNRDRHQANASCLRGRKGKLLQQKLGITHPISTHNRSNFDKMESFGSQIAEIARKQTLNL